MIIIIINNNLSHHETLKDMNKKARQIKFRDFCILGNLLTASQEYKILV